MVEISSIIPSICNGYHLTYEQCCAVIGFKPPASTWGISYVNSLASFYWQGMNSVTAFSAAGKFYNISEKLYTLDTLLYNTARKWDFRFLDLKFIY